MGWGKNIMGNGKTWRDVCLLIQTTPCILRMQKWQVRSQALFHQNCPQMRWFLGAHFHSGNSESYFKWPSHFRRVKAYHHIHGVRTALSQRLEMPQEGRRYISLPFTMNENEERYRLPKYAKNIAITRYRCAVINSYSKAFCFSHDFHCRKLY